MSSPEDEFQTSEGLAASDADFNELARIIASGDLVMFVGAGLSVAAGAPTWDQLGNDLRAELHPPTSEQSLPLVAQYFRNQFGDYALYCRLREKLHGSSLRPTRVHELLCSLPINVFLTTNWDSLIEHELRAIGRRAHLVVHPPDLAAWDDHEVQVIKPHGDIERPDSLVVTARDYSQLLDADTALRAKLVDLLRYRPVCFVGYSMRDEDVTLLYSQAVGELGVMPRAAFMFTFETDAHLLRELKRRGVRPITIRADVKDRERALTATLERLSDKVRECIQSNGASPTRTCDVLIVDDVQAIRIVFKTFLERKFDLRVETAVDGMDACLRLATVRPSLILVDLAMPHMNGWRLIEVLRENPDYADIAIVIVTGCIENEHFERAEAMGIPFLMKPCDLGDFSEVIARYVPAAAER